jgi:hypothetical protein
MKKLALEGYTVEMLLVDAPPGTFVQYSGKNVDVGMAFALAEHLRKNRTGGRVKNQSGEIVDEWSAPPPKVRIYSGESFSELMPGEMLFEADAAQAAIVEMIKRGYAKCSIYVLKQEE